MRLSFDDGRATVRIVDRNETLAATPIAPLMAAVLSAGGLVPYVRAAATVRTAGPTYSNGERADDPAPDARHAFVDDRRRRLLEQLHHDLVRRRFRVTLEDQTRRAAHVSRRHRRPIPRRRRRPFTIEPGSRTESPGA